ncbi:TPA: type II secretion system protein N [Salmonella enterica subsp. enterica serovar Virchow]
MFFIPFTAMRNCHIHKRLSRQKRLLLRIWRHLPTEKKLCAGLYLLPVLLLFRLLFSLWQYADVLPDEGPSPIIKSVDIAHFQGYQPERWLEVSQQHWFGEPVQKEVVAAATLPEVPFRAILRGISWGTRPAVVIEEEGQQQMYAEGDVLAGSGAKVMHIYPDQIQISYAGKIHCLIFDDWPADKSEPVCPTS